jgi:DMSO/TMAO reductase YedYZ molybdopterin-dependent catalytic subunit
MQRNHRRWIIAALVLSLLALGVSSCGGGVPKVDWELKVTGEAVQTPLALQYKELTEMPQKDLNEILMEKSLGEDVVTSWSGVPVEDILDQAGVSDYSTITALAADGYAIEITKDEMEGAVVALKKSGEWISQLAEEEGKGPIRLVCPETPANRWVFQLQELQVNP